MVYYYYIMNHKTTKQSIVRTQVMLTPQLLEQIDRVRRHLGESRSAYLRKAAELRMVEKSGRHAHLEKLAEAVIGQIRLRNHPIWRNRRAVEHWRRALRKEWQ